MYPSEPFDTMQGFRQGYPLSCEGVLRKYEIHRNGTIFQICVQLLAYAHDVDIIGRTKRNITAAFSVY